MRYRNALRWLDGELRKLFRGFDERQLTKRTLFILTADHGEGLGDRRLMTHGANIFDEETKVPFCWLIPDMEPKTVSATVSLIDLVPTLTEMVGGTTRNLDGKSLLPLIRDPQQVWRRYYYLENTNGSTVGIVSGRVKLVYAVKTDTMARFDMSMDPKEMENLFDLENDADQRLLFHLIYYRPDLFIEELSRKPVRAIYDRLHDRIDTLPPAAARLLGRIEAVRLRNTLRPSPLATMSAGPIRLR